MHHQGLPPQNQFTQKSLFPNKNSSLGFMIHLYNPCVNVFLAAELPVLD